MFRAIFPKLPVGASIPECWRPFLLRKAPRTSLSFAHWSLRAAPIGQLTIRQLRKLELGPNSLTGIPSSEVCYDWSLEVQCCFNKTSTVKKMSFHCAPSVQCWTFTQKVNQKAPTLAGFASWILITESAQFAATSTSGGGIDDCKLFVHKSMWGKGD